MTRTRVAVLGVAVLALVTAGVAVWGNAEVTGRAVAVAAAVTTTSAPTTTTTTAPPAPVTQSTSPAPPASSAQPVGAGQAGKIKPGVTRNAPATHYASDGGGACSYDPGPDPLTVAMNWSDYEDSKACGAYILVRANGKSITVRVTNLCPAPCRVGQLDLSREAFARLADPNVGEIPVTWSLVSPALEKKISIRYKTGSSQWWCGIQAIDHRNPVARLEVQAGGQWKELRRMEYNYFLSENGAGCGGAIAITDIYGERLVVNALPVKADVVQATNLQFAAR